MFFFIDFLSIDFEVNANVKKKYGIWEICTPVDSVIRAQDLFRSHPNQFNISDPIQPSQIRSMIHTYDVFGIKDSIHSFVIVPDFDVHLVCQQSNIVRSLRGLPYPSLSSFAQSCIDRYDSLELCDLVDGANLNEAWGEQHLDLEGVHDVEWTRAMTLRKRATVGNPHGISDWRVRPRSKRELWQSMVRTKAERLDDSHPATRYITQYRHIGSPDPWTTPSIMS